VEILRVKSEKKKQVSSLCAHRRPLRIMKISHYLYRLCQNGCVTFVIVPGTVTTAVQL